METGATESGAQLVSRLATKFRPSLINLSPEIIPGNGPNLKEIIEISGESNIGKTIHLMELIAQTVIPKEFGGKAASAIVIDTNSNFHLPLLATIIEKHILYPRNAINTAADTEDMRHANDHIDATVANSLKNILFFKCYTHAEFDLVLLNCADILSTNMNISLLAIDSIAAFYWCYMSKQNILIRMETYLKQLQFQLRKLSENFGILIIYTKPKNFGNASLSFEERIDYKIHLKPVNNNREIKEAQLIHGSHRFGRNYSINNFGIDWIRNK